jgi:hypothetical protein
MNKTYIYVALGLAVLVGGYIILKPKKESGLPKQITNLDEPTLKTFVAYLFDRGYTVDQLPEDVKANLTPEQMETIKEALSKYKP